MKLTINGTVLNDETFVPSPFSMSFSVSGGNLLSGGCDSALMGATVSNFSAEIGNNALAAPPTFGANITADPYPNCAAQLYGNLVGGPLVLESKDAMFGPHSTLFGSIGDWQISEASFTVSSVPEPGSAVLMLLGLLGVSLWLRACGQVAAVVLRQWWHPVSHRH